METPSLLAYWPELLILLGPLVFAALLMLRPPAKPRRELFDSSFAKAEYYQGKKLASLKEGNFGELGLDEHTHQRVYIPEAVRCMNLINVGPVGSGKTTYFLATLMMQDIARSGNAVVIFDSQHALFGPVAALCRKYGRNLVVYPDAGFNPLAGEGSAQQRARAFADLLPQILEVPAQSDSSHYVRQQQLFVNTIVPLFERVHAMPMILQELVTLASDVSRREALLTKAGLCPEVSEYRLYLGGWDKDDWDRNLVGLKYLINRLLCDERSFLYNQRSAPTLAGCIDERSVILIREGKYSGTDRALGLMFMTALQEYVSRRDLKRSNHFLSVYLDEAYMYFNQHFPDFIASSRQKRAALHLGFQSFDQFGEHTQVVSGNARTWVVHGGLGAKDAQRVADNIGRSIYITRSNSTTRTFDLQQSRTTDVEGYEHDYLVTPEKVMHLPQESALVLTVDGRQKQPHRLVCKPQPLQLDSMPVYKPPKVPAARPMNIWEQEQTASKSAPQGRRRAAPDPTNDAASN